MGDQLLNFVPADWETTKNVISAAVLGLLLWIAPNPRELVRRVIEGVKDWRSQKKGQ